MARVLHLELHGDIVPLDEVPISAEELRFLELVVAKCRTGDFRVSNDADGQGHPHFDYKQLVDGRSWGFRLYRAENEPSEVPATQDPAEQG